MENKIHEVVIEIEIEKSMDIVWQAMLNEVEQWWPMDFLGLPGSGGIKFEPRAGGRLYEENADGGALLWGTVLMIIPGSAIELCGYITPSFGGPSVNFIKLSITEGENGKTLFRLDNAVLGNLADAASIDTGWRYLYGAMKEYCEKKAG